MELLAWISGVATGVAIMGLIDLWRSVSRRRRAQQANEKLNEAIKRLYADPEPSYETYHDPQQGLFVSQVEIERRLR